MSIDLNAILPWEPGWDGCIRTGPGWDQLILDLHNDLVKIYPEYTVLQCKEKFGSLRFYTSGIPADKYDEFMARVRLAEAATYEIDDDEDV